MSGELGPGAVPAPPGLNANFVNPPDHTKQLLVQHIICITLATIAVGVRLFTRAAITRNLGWDDYMALVAWALTVTFSALLLASIQYGFGRHLWDVPAIWLLPLLKLGYVVEILYLPISLSIKTAFLLFFGRIFAVNNNKLVKWLVYGAIAANVIFYVAFIFDTIFFCTPIARSWNPEIPGHCGPDHVAPYISGIWSFMTDFYILILPMYCVWNLQVKRNQRLRLTLIFSVGLFACAASVIRFAYTVTLVRSLDDTWNLCILSLWSVLEIHVGLICCCLPAFLPFLEHAFPNLLSYITRLTSLLSLSRKSKSTNKSTTTEHSKSNPPGSITVKSDYVVTGDYAQLEEGVGGYREVSDQARLARDGAGRGGGGTRFSTVAARGEIGYPMSNLK